MAARSVWKGILSFGMVVMPVKLFNGTTDSRKETAMVNLHTSCGTRLKQPKWCPHDEVFVEKGDTTKGYELGEDNYMMLTESDLASLPLPSTSSIQIEAFVRRDSFVDPRWIKDTYFLTPDKVGGKAFMLVLKAMAAEGVVGISKITFRANSRETLCIVRPFDHPFGDLLLLQSLNWEHELKDSKEFVVTGEVSEKEVNMGSMLVRSMTEEFDPSKYQDGYTRAFKEMIEAKLDGRTIEPVVQKEESIDLMDALEKSLAAIPVMEQQIPTSIEDAERIDSEASLANLPSLKEFHQLKTQYKNK